MRKKNKILMFDFDGVLVDTFKLIWECNKIVHSPKVTKQEVRNAFMGNFYSAAGSWYLPERAKRFWDTYASKFEDIMFFNRVPETLKKLSRRFTMCIITSNNGKTVQKFLSLHHLSKYFKYIKGREFSKSKTAKISYVLKKNNLLPKDCLFVTDTVGDILEARKCGIDSIAVAQGFHSRFVLKKYHPAIIVNHFNELPQAVNKFFKNKQAVK